MSLQRYLAPCALGLAAAGLVGLAFRLPACGPFTVAARFDDLGRPDVPRERFLKGELGIVRPGWPILERIVAYRHLTGLGLDAAAQASVLASESSAGPEDLSSPQPWLEARARVTGAGDPPLIDPDSPLPGYHTYPRIHGDAFRSAARTLEARIQTHGAAAPEVLAWVRAQDQVFVSTREHPAIPEPVPGPSWLRADRDYQIAAALFYAERFEAARTAFAAIAQDPASPWRAWGAYLQARAWAREASLMDGGVGDTAALDRWRQAQGHLEGLLKDPALAEVHAAARRYLDLVRHHTEPALLLAETCRELLAPQPGSRFAALVARYQSAARASGERMATLDGSEGSRAADFHAWLRAMSPRPPEAAGAAAADRWARTRSLPWLVAALHLAPPDHPERPALLAATRVEAATAVPRPTLGWLRLCLDLPALDPAGQRAHLDAALRTGDLPPWAENQLRARRRALAADLAEWCAWAPSRLAGTELVGVSAPEPPGPEDPVVAKHGPRPALLDRAEAAVLNRELPLAVLADLAQRSALGPALSPDLAQAAWTRALLLERWDTARSLLPHLDAELRAQALRELRSSDPLERRFEGACILMEHPGLRPDLTPGLGRGNGNLPRVGDFDPLRDNWWCGDPDKPEPSRAVRSSFLDPAWAEPADREAQALARIPDAWIHFGETVLTFAQARPEDPRVPQALHRFVRLTRSPGCPGPALSALSRRAFRLLHQKYPDSPWTQQTPYHY